MKVKHTGPCGAQPKVTVHKRYPEKLMRAKIERRSPLNDKRRLSEGKPFKTSIPVGP
jgi:hypothetical protein